MILRACFAVAGPVTNNKVKFTNRDSWSIEGDIIQEKVGIRKVRLINDFLAVGYGLLTIDEETECKCLQVFLFNSVLFCALFLLFLFVVLILLLILKKISYNQKSFVLN